MNKTELLKELTTSGPVWVWCNLYASDGEYIQAVKAHIVEIVKASPEDTKFSAQRRENGLYLN